MTNEKNEFNYNSNSNLKSYFVVKDFGWIHRTLWQRTVLQIKEFSKKKYKNLTRVFDQIVTHCHVLAKYNRSELSSPHFKIF